MRPIKPADLLALAAGQVLAVVVAAASAWGVWAWLVDARPLR